MPSFDNRSRSTFSSVPIPWLSHSTSSLDLLSSETRSTTPLSAPTSDLAGPETGESASLPGHFSSHLPSVTRQLPAQKDTGAVPSFTRALSDALDTVPRRAPVVIKSQWKKKASPSSRATHPARRLAVSLVGVLILFLITTFTLFAATPLGHEFNMGLNSLQFNSNLVNNANTNPNLVAQATATAVYHKQMDGYAPNSTGGQTVVNNGTSLSWPLGQCTDWANRRYHALTGFWVSWTGNANQWAAGARAAGWTVSSTPHVPSIIVLQAGVQQASGYGHVAVVESMVNSTTVHTSNMNWSAWDTVTYVDFTVGAGVSFVWHP
jgi:surface antigen